MFGTHPGEKPFGKLLNLHCIYVLWERKWFLLFVTIGRVYYNQACNLLSWAVIRLVVVLAPKWQRPPLDGRWRVHLATINSLAIPQIWHHPSQIVPFWHQHLPDCVAFTQHFLLVFFVCTNRCVAINTRILCLPATSNLYIVVSQHSIEIADACYNKSKLSNKGCYVQYCDEIANLLAFCIVFSFHEECMGTVSSNLQSPGKYKNENMLS